MRLEVTRKSDLAVRVMRVPAGSSKRVKGPALAEAVGSTAGFVAQVMNPLVRKGWVRSDPGPSGGYLLAVDPASVSLLAVIESVEGPTDAGRCVSANLPCRESGTCALHYPWQRARAHFLSELDATSVAEALLAEGAMS